MNSLAWFTRCHVSHGITDFVFRLAIVRASVAIRTLTGQLLPRFGFSIIYLILMSFFISYNFKPVTFRPRLELFYRMSIVASFDFYIRESSPFYLKIESHESPSFFMCHCLNFPSASMSLSVISITRSAFHFSLTPPVLSCPVSSLAI